jgi:GH43 family beta-xylosidase
MRVRSTTLSVSPVGGRPTVGHVALDHGIGVRIPASQPNPKTSSVFATSEAEGQSGLGHNSFTTFRDGKPDIAVLVPSAAAVCATVGSIRPRPVGDHGMRQA